MGRARICQDAGAQWYWERQLVEGFRSVHGWRTDIYESVRADERLQYARFIEPSGRAFRVPMQQIRQATEGIVPRAGGRRTFTLDPQRGILHNINVEVQFEDEVLRAEPEPGPPFSNTEHEARRKGWTGGESEWHRRTTDDVADHPDQYSIDVVNDPVVRRWRDSCTALEDRQRLWLQLWTQKHPDVVFEHQSGKLTVVEVEPRNTLVAGIAQLIGDYLVNLNVDRRAVGCDPYIEGVLVLDEGLTPQETELWDGYLHARNCRVYLCE